MDSTATVDENAQGTGDTQVSFDTTQQQLKEDEITATMVIDWIRRHKGVCRHVWGSTLVALAEMGVGVEITPRSYEVFRVKLVAYILKFSKDKRDLGRTTTDEAKSNKTVTPSPVVTEKDLKQTADGGQPEFNDTAIG